MVLQCLPETLFLNLLMRLGELIAKSLPFSLLPMMFDSMLLPFDDVILLMLHRVAWHWVACL